MVFGSGFFVSAVAIFGYLGLDGGLKGHSRTRSVGHR